MAWYRTGTISLTNGSTTVIGSSTAWIANAAVGEALYATDGKLYEIASVASNTSLTLATPYLGTTASGQTYVIVPSQSYIRDLAAQAATLVNNYSTIYNTVGQGKFAEGTVSAPSITFATDTDTGFYHSAANEVTFVANGVAQFKYGTGGVTFLNGINATSLTLSGNTTIGNASSDTLTVNATPTLAVNPTLSAGTANGVLYLNGSKVATSGSALTFNGTTLTATGFSGPLTGNVTGNVSGTSSNVTGTVAAANGGTGQSSYAVGDLLYASTTTALSKLADVETGNALISGGVETAPAWGKIGLTTHVSGTLPVANGGTGVTTSTGTGNVVLSASPTLTGTLTAAAITASGTVTCNGNLTANGNNTLGNASTDTLTIGSNTATVNNTLTFAYDAATTNTVVDVVSVQRTSSGTPANGIGAGVAFKVETTASNIETGATIDAIVTDVTAGAEDFDLTFNTMTAGAAASEKMRLNSVGNLGLGVTPSAWDVNVKAIQQPAGSVFSYATTEMHTTFNAYFDGAWKYKNSGYASDYRQYAGQHIWQTAPSGTAGNAITFTQAMTLDASGNLLVGTTTAQGKLTVNGTTGNAIYMGMNSADGTGLYGYNSNNAGYFTLYTNGSNGSGVSGWANSTVLEAVPASTGGLVFSAYSGNMIFQTGSGRNERMRIDSSGNLLVGATALALSNSSSVLIQAQNPAAIIIQHPNGTGSGTAYEAYSYNGGLIGQITQNGTTGVSYNTSSDYRLKENIQPMQNALGVVAQLNPVTYTWKADGSDGQGFIAHELQAVVPDCVTGEKDAVDAEGNPVYQGIDTSFLVATLTKAIQELKAELDATKAEVDALKGK